jgi:hypothetical protein
MINIDGLGFWIKDIAGCGDDPFENIIQKCKAYNIKWIAVYTGSHFKSSQWQKFSVNKLISLCKSNGIKILTWNSCNPGGETFQVSLISSFFKSDCDGHIIDVSPEWGKIPNKAFVIATFFERLRASIPQGSFIGYSADGIIENDINFPYKEFGYFCDGFFPQSNYFDYNLSIKDFSKKLDTSWDTFFKTNPSSAKPIHPVGTSFSQRSVFDTNMVDEFIRKYYDYGVSLYCWEKSNKLLWETIENLPIKKLSQPQKSKKGEDNPYAKLDEIKVREIRVKYKAGKSTQAQIAAEYGISRSLVGHIVNYKIWTEVK